MVTIENKVIAAYEDVRNDKTDTNWLLMNYIDDKTDTLKLAGSGSGGLAELTKALSQKEASFGYLRVTIGNDELSRRAKFVLISWCGNQVKVMRKAKLSVHNSEVKEVIKAFAVEIQATNMGDLSASEIDNKIKKAMGANYDRQSSDY